MKRSLLVLVMLVAAVRIWAADAGFSGSLSPGDLKATGLDRLTPAERQRLDELIASYQHDTVAAAQKAAADAVVAKQAAEAEAKAAKAEAAESKAGKKGFFAKAKVMIVPGTQIEYLEIKSTIPGKFSGWGPYTVFPLANGQRWQVANNNDSYYTPKQENVEVEIRPASTGGFWMYFPTLKSRVRVKLLEEKK